MADRPGMLGREATRYLVAQQFLTRLPTPTLDYEPGGLARAARYFPLVGLVVGALAGMVWAIMAPVLPAPVAAGLALATMILVTGALHEDGLADCCDGLGGGASAEKALDIMRDSRIGVYGGVGLIVALGLRWVGLASLDVSAGLWALVLAPVFGRAAMTLMLRFGAYARPDGAARDVRDGVTGQECAIALIFAVVAAVLGGPAALAALAVCLIATYLWLRWLTHRLGGYTGDGLGAAEQICQIVTLTVLAGAWA